MSIDEVVSAETLRRRLVDSVVRRITENPKLNCGQLPVPGLSVYMTMSDHTCECTRESGFCSLCVDLTLQCREGIDVCGSSYSCGEGFMTVSATNVPVTYTFEGASESRPYVSICFELCDQILTELVENHPEIKLRHKMTEESVTTAGAMTIDKISPDLYDAFIRLLRLCDTPERIGVMKHLIGKEIAYLLLMSEAGAGLVNFFSKNTVYNRVNKTINWMRTNVGNEDFDINVMARTASMTRSTYYRHFKDITGVSPLQYYKQLCLHKAQRLMLVNGMSASQAAFSVGYKSPNQFSRDYRKVFGLPPRASVTTRSTSLRPGQMSV